MLAATGLAIFAPGAGLFSFLDLDQWLNRRYPNRAAVRSAVLLAAREHRVDPAVVQSMIQAESAFRTDAISSRGALGLMQLMPETARELGYDPHDWRENIEAGTMYLGILLRRYKDQPNRVQMALAAYNAGPGTVDRYKGMPPYRETRTYVSRVMSHYRHLKRRKTPLEPTQSN